MKLCKNDYFMITMLWSTFMRIGKKIGFFLINGQFLNVSSFFLLRDFIRCGNWPWELFVKGIYQILKIPKTYNVPNYINKTAQYIMVHTGMSGTNS